MEFLRQGIRDLSPIYIYLIGILLVGFAFMIGSLPMDLALKYQMTEHTDITDITITKFYESPNFSLVHMNSSLGLAIMILMFISAAIALFTWYNKVHHQSILRLFNNVKSLDFSRILFGFGLWVFFITLMEVFNYFNHAEGFFLKFDLIKFLYLLPVAFLLIPLQSTTEELVFRSYLPKALAKFIPMPLIIIIITSILFALIHASNPEVQKLGLIPMMSYYFSAGIFLSIVTLLDDRLELAMGIHAAVNIFGTVIVSYADSALQTDGIWGSATPNPWIATLSLAICATAFIYIASKKYNWPPLSIILKKLDLKHDQA